MTTQEYFDLEISCVKLQYNPFQALQRVTALLNSGLTDEQTKLCINELNKIGMRLNSFITKLEGLALNNLPMFL